MFPLILNVKQFDGAWSWQVVVQVVLAPVCVYLCACLQCFYSPTTTTLCQSITHIWTPCKREGPSLLVSPAPGKGWGLQAPAITLAHLSKVHPSPPPNLGPPPRLSLPQLPLFSPPPLLARPRPVLWCGGAGTPVPYWLRGGWWFTRGLDPSPHHPRPLDLPTDQMQPPGLLHPKPKSKFLGHSLLPSSNWKMVWLWHWSDQQICRL